MIRLAVMTDRARVIGDSTPEGNNARFSLITKALVQAICELYQGESIAAERSSINACRQARNKEYIIMRDENFMRPKGLEDLIICTDCLEMVDQYKDSDDELLILGGLNVFKLFTLFAAELDVAEADELIPGDLVYDEWDKGEFELIRKERMERI